MGDSKRIETRLGSVEAHSVDIRETAENNKTKCSDLESRLGKLEDRVSNWEVEESSVDESIQRQKQDHEFTVKLFTEVLGVEIGRNSIAKVLMLGKREAGTKNPRPILVGLESLCID
ncbi:hypothetical protein Pcinc_025854 [Petrolisthes cinctipes]|uniref:Uncharacterized protein n=1 Tax=Petrolisthes cinctipes TaxID=88211 RepID=A0AAE1F828_PETCI|nr:hypothetical protein Pcinc_025854 [Petrolisthes cinctipes]